MAEGKERASEEGDSAQSRQSAKLFSPHTRWRERGLGEFHFERGELHCGTLYVCTLWDSVSEKEREKRKMAERLEMKIMTYRTGSKEAEVISEVRKRK
jgi:hypothetical protein